MRTPIIVKIMQVLFFNKKYSITQLKSLHPSQPSHQPQDHQESYGPILDQNRFDPLKSYCSFQSLNIILSHLLEGANWIKHLRVCY